jgi:hypothetical protein
MISVKKVYEYNFPKICGNCEYFSKLDELHPSVFSDTCICHKKDGHQYFLAFIRWKTKTFRDILNHIKEHYEKTTASDSCSDFKYAKLIVDGIAWTKHSVINNPEFVYWEEDYD